MSGRTLEEQGILDRLKAKGLLYIHTTMSGPGLEPYKMWAIELDGPWAGAWGEEKHASAFTPELVRLMNEDCRAAGLRELQTEPARPDHDGKIYYVKDEVQ